MKRALAIAAFLVNFPALCVAEGNAPDRAAGCIAEHHDSVGCFIGQVSYRFELCKLSVQLADAGGNAGSFIVLYKWNRDLSDFYAAALKKFTKNKAAQSRRRTITPSGDLQ